ncbi:MAG: MerR family transcriptional regulator [Longimicrobiales bacterium]
MAGDHLTVGELAERTGLTVRTLHHYDQIGLLRPAARTPAGYRVYGPPEVRRLQHIASLRRLGLSLDDIARCLDADDPPLPVVLDAHLDHLDEEILTAMEQRDRLRRIRKRLDEDLDVDEWLVTIHETLRFERHYSPEQLETLAERADDMGLGRLAEVQAQWIEIFDALGGAVDAGLSPTHPKVEALARQARGLISEFTGDDPGIERSLQAMYEAEGARPLTDRGIHMRRDVWAYLGSAMEALRQEGGDP